MDAAGKVVSTKSVVPGERRVYMDYDISGLGVGEYKLEVELTEGGKSLARTVKGFELMKGFW